MHHLGKFPLNEREFEELFPNEAACIAYLFHTRWPNGFTCPSCLEHDLSAAPSRLTTCIHCGEQTSLTRGTILDNTDMSLHDWLLSLWWLSKRDVDTLIIPDRLHLSGYQTARGWRHQLRMVMALADDHPCSGVVEIGSRLVVPGDEEADPVLVLAAAERLFLSGNTGRIHIEVIEELTATAVRSFVRKSLEPGCTVVGPRLSPYEEAAHYGDVYVLDSGLDCPVGIHGMLSNFETWLSHIRQEGSVMQYLQPYCDEYCFQHNTTIQGDEPTVFSTLLNGCFAELTESCPEPVST